MGKTRYAPSTRRFADVVHAPCVYAAELSNGYLKVGVSNSGRARMMSLANEAKRVFGAELHRFHVVPRLTVKAAYETETLLVRHIEKLAQPIPGRREFFDGVSFERAVAAIRKVCRDIKARA